MVKDPKAQKSRRQTDEKETLLPTNDVARILHFLHKKTHINFINYKMSMVNRRIQRRLVFRKIDSLQEYFIFLRKRDDEVDALLTDLLITVTHFFREPEKFIALQKEVFPIIVRERSEEDPLRIWVPGCATGEEAYSIAIALTEFIEQNHLHVQFQIFATDVNSAVIEKARRGLYQARIVEYLSPIRLKRFFVKVDAGYQVKKDLQEKCLFAVHNVAENPPFLHLDLISCLNVLIYMDMKLKKKILSLFSYALKPNGFLMLGDSESVSVWEKQFQLKESKHKIYVKAEMKTLREKRENFFAKEPRIVKAKLQMKKPVMMTLSQAEKITKLKEALVQTQEYADSLINELESITEELQSANEEQLVNNVELQKANEELETSREELQAGNEELQILNAELQIKEEAKARLAAIVESSDDVILSKNLEGIITSWNKGAQRLYGYTAEEIIGKSVATLIPPKKNHDFNRIMRKIKQGKTVEHYETQRITKEKNIIDVSITVSPIKAKGAIIGASTIARDITERKRIEKENAGLYKDAQKAITLRDTFISIASHELKTPLTSLKMYTQMLQRQFENRGEVTESEYLQKMDHQIDNLSRLIRDLLDVSSLEHGELALHQEKFDLNMLVKETKDNLQTTTRRHTIIVQGSVDKKVWGDRFRIAQVLVNLCTNAIKYSPHADKIVIKLTQLKKRAVIAVEDFGIGIEKKHQGAIFERFYRANGSLERTYPGLGMGLYISNEIIRRHSGKIQVKSSKRKGSVFSFSLPLLQ